MRNFWTRIVIVFAVALASLAPAQNPITSEQKREVLDAMGSIIGGRAFVPGVDFSKWDEFVAKHKASIDKSATQDEFASAVNDALEEFGFSHIVLTTPRAARSRVERKVVGIGILVQPEESGLRVVQVYPDTPAMEVGLQPGDLVVEADGKKLTAGMSLVGEEGSEVTFTILRNDKERKTFTVKRRKYSNVRKETLAWPNKETAVLTVHTFDLSYDRSRVDELMDEASKAKNLILDLRSNGGGVVANMLHLIGNFLPRTAVIGTFVNRDMVRQYIKETGGNAADVKEIAEWAEEGKLRPFRSRNRFSGNVAVLVNEGSGSASEITATALKEHLGAPIVGKKSAGAVLVSMISPIANGFSLQYPLMDFVSYKGVRLEGNGIVPDAEAPTPRFKEPDKGVEQALAVLAKIEVQKGRGG